MKQFFAEIIEKEYINIFHFAVIIFAFGIGAYFTLPSEPNIKQVFPPAAAFISLALIFKRRDAVFLLCLAIAIFMAGIGVITLKAKNIDAPRISHATDYVSIKGRIRSINILENGYQIIFDNLTIKDSIKNENGERIVWPENKTPERIRLVVRTDINEAQIGSYVKFRAKLMPLPQPVVVGGYDFAKYAYFEQIGAIGFVVSDLELRNTDLNNGFEKLSNKFLNFRKTLAEYINQTLGKKIGNIASAITVGEYKGIDKDIIQSMRISGLSHILSVSGMHMSIVVIIIFATLRQILALFPHLALHYNIKAVSGVAAIIFSLIYLLISGMSVAAVRSFIMSTLFVVAIIISRRNTTMRSIAISALLILIVSPESLISASFQMSFAAVVALVGSFDICFKLSRIKAIKNRPLQFIVQYFISLSLTSLVASIATTPFAIYHFNQYSNYSIIANLLAVPVTSIIIMPFMVISLLAYPVDMAYLPLQIMGFGIKIMVMIANLTAEIPYAKLTIANIGFPSFIMFVVSGILCFISLSYIRYLAAPCFVLGLWLAHSHKLPDIIITMAKTPLIGIHDYNQLAVNKMRGGKYAKEYWQRYYGYNEISNFEQVNWPNLQCNENGCLYEKYDKQVAIALNKELACVANPDLSIGFVQNCDGINISYSNIEQNKTYAIYLEPLLIKNVNDDLENRSWNKLTNH